MSIKNKLIGFILINDLLREDSIQTVQNLKENNYKVNILSGDRKQSVIELANKLSLQESEIKWELLPK